MNTTCSAEVCPVILNSTCVFYEGANLVYIGVTSGDNIQTALQKINAKVEDAGLGYIFTNGIIQTTPGAPVGLGGALINNTTINGNYTLTFTGSLESSKLITTGGTSSEFVKGDGSLDSNSYQLTGNYITALTGDGTASGPGSSLFTLANVNLYAGTFGTSTQVPVITVNNKGLVTSISTTLIYIPSDQLLITGDVFGVGFTGNYTTLTLNTVNTNVYGTNTLLKFSVNGKGLITSASPITNFDITGLLGYTPVPNSRTLSINGVTYDLTVNRSWTVDTLPYQGGHAGQFLTTDGSVPSWATIPISGGTVTNVSVTSGTGISASVANPSTTPNITITNTAPDRTVVLNNGTGISVTGTYPNFTITNTGTTSISTLQQVVNVGNGISNFGGSGTADIQSTNFTSNRTLYLNNNGFATIKIEDNLNGTHYTIIDIDTLNLNGTSYNWSSIVSPAVPTLQQVTDVGATTTNSIVINPNVSGSANLSLYSNPNNTALSVVMTGALSRGIEIVNYDSSGTFPFNYSLFDGDASYIPLTTINDAGELTAKKLIKQGGTSSQYLMADGSVTTGGFEMNFMLMGA